MTSTSVRAIAICTTLALSTVIAPLANAKDKPEVHYFLSRTNVSVSVEMTLVSCPAEGGDLPEVSVDWTVNAEGAPDPDGMVRVDVSSGFLAKRSNAFEFYPNGTLAAFNGKSEGQGGAIIGSILKTVSTIAPLVAGSPSRGASTPGTWSAPIPGNALYCREGVRNVLEAISVTKSEIRALEDRVLLKTATSAEIDLLDRKRKKRVALVDSLTFRAPAEFGVQGRTSNWIGKVALPKLLGEWFSPKSGDAGAGAVPFDKTEMVGLAGFGVTINPKDNQITEKLKNDKTLDTKIARNLVYRQPALAKVSVTPLDCPVGHDCTEVLPLDAPLPIGQWGGIRSLPVGSAGLFGSREAAASFDQFGTPLKLSYGSDGGASEIGASLEAAGNTATAIADAETAALEREVKREELRKKLIELRTEE